LPDGKFTRYHATGEKSAEGTYKDIVKIGKWKYYDATGKLIYMVVYDNKGTKIKEKQYVKDAKANTME